MFHSNGYFDNIIYIDNFSTNSTILNSYLENINKS